jgi:predicted nucleic acid-binding protein
MECVFQDFKPEIELNQVGLSACTTPAVLAEYYAGVSSGLPPPDAWANLPVVTLIEEEDTFAAALPPRLGSGERTCLAVAVHRQGLLNSDDDSTELAEVLDARHIAQRHGVSTTGTVGILVLCVRRDHFSRDQAEALLAEISALGYRSPVTSLVPLLDEQSTVSLRPELRPRGLTERHALRQSQRPGLAVFQ